MMTMDTQSLQSADLSHGPRPGLGPGHPGHPGLGPGAVSGLSGLGPGHPGHPGLGPGAVSGLSVLSARGTDGWSCQAPLSPSTAVGAQSAPRKGVSVIRSHHHTVDESRAQPLLTAPRSPVRLNGRLTMLSPASSESISSECSQDKLDRTYTIRLSPEPTLAPLGVIGYPYPYCEAAALPPLPPLPGPPPRGGDPLDALADLYAPLHHPYAHPLRQLRPWLPWRGLMSAPPQLTAAHYPAASASTAATTNNTATLKFGMDRILSDEGCGTTSRRGASDAVPCSVAYPVAVHGLLAPTPLRIYGHAVDARSSSNRARGSPLGPQGTSAIIHGSGGSGKRKRSWSRAVFSNLQRKGLEKRFQLQKYITKPDRRQLAATLGLTDAQVKVWFQNRRMKWRHTKESKQQQHQQQPRLDDLQQDNPKCDAPPPRCDSS